MRTGKQSTNAPVWSAGVMGMARWKGNMGNRGRPVGDRINAVLAAAGYNFGLLLRWLAELMHAIIRALAETVPVQNIA